MLFCLLVSVKSSFFRFGSVIVGAIKSKSARREKRGETKGSSAAKRRQRGSFSFLGGMQVAMLG